MEIGRWDGVGMILVSATVMRYLATKRKGEQLRLVVGSTTL